MRTPLTSPPPTFKWVYITFGAAICFAIIFEIAVRSSPTHPAFEIVCVLGAMLSFAFTIGQTTNVVTYRYLRKPLEFDEHNLYIMRKDGETAIPFTDILEIRYAFYNKNSFRFNANYRIRYRLDDRGQEALITVFRDNRPTFDQFTKLVQTVNPLLKITNWSITGEDLLWRFRNRK